jgi:hypothetical protein
MLVNDPCRKCAASFNDDSRKCAAHPACFHDGCRKDAAPANDNSRKCQRPLPQEFRNRSASANELCRRNAANNNDVTNDGRREMQR